MAPGHAVAPCAGMRHSLRVDGITEIAARVDPFDVDDAVPRPMKMLDRKSRS